MRRIPASLWAVPAVVLLGWSTLMAGRNLARAAEPPASGSVSQGASSPAQTQETAKPGAEPAAPVDEKGTPQTNAAEKSKGRALQAGSTLPPKNLKKVGDHWTPYDPPDPESFAPGATLHIIVPGDTLWDLADLAFGNPYLWPQIWNENRYILDSHWIYPGDPLLMPARPTVVSEIVPQGQEGAPPAPPAVAPDQSAPAVQQPLTADDEAPAPEAQEPLSAEAPPNEGPAPTPERPPEGAHAARFVPKMVPLAGDSDIRCSGFIAPKDTIPDYFIANQEDENKVGLTEGDVVYLNRGKDNGHVDQGTEYSVVVREGEVRHPVTGKKLGYYYKRLGTVKVLAAQERTAIGTISLACDDIRTGYDLVPLNITPQPAKPVPPFGRLMPEGEPKATGYIVHTLDNPIRVATGFLVDIDLGYDDGLKPGDYLTIFLPNQPYDKYRKINYDYQWQNRRFQTPPLRKDERNEYPAKVIGQLVILTTERHTATAKIVNAVREIAVGDQVALH